MDGQNQPLERVPHLAAALSAVTLAVVAVAAFGFYARSLEHRAILALATGDAIIEREGIMAPVKNQGMALQLAALDTPGLLPVFGSSELNVHAEYNRPFHASVLFRDRPSGFTIFPVGKAATTCLILLQKLSALGPALKGQKLVVSLTPSWFIERLTARADGYAGNFSDLHVGALTFDTGLSLQLRQDAARRMLQYPLTVANRPLLRFALESLAEGSPLTLACYDAVLPLGMMHNAILRFQDHVMVVCYLWGHPPRRAPSTSVGGARPLDWPELYRRAEAVYRPLSANNEFGLDHDLWDRQLRKDTLLKRNTRSDEGFLQTIEKNKEWGDLELLLRGLNELGAQPLLMSMPIHGSWYDACGVTCRGRRAYYEKLRAISAQYRMPLVDFADREDDLLFCHDNMGHLAPTGLVHYSQVFDGFFHGEVPRPSAFPDCAGPRRTGTAPAAPISMRDDKRHE